MLVLATDGRYELPLAARPNSEFGNFDGCLHIPNFGSSIKIRCARSIPTPIGQTMVGDGTYQTKLTEECDKFLAWEDKGLSVDLGKSGHEEGYNSTKRQIN